MAGQGGPVLFRLSSPFSSASPPSPHLDLKMHRSESLSLISLLSRSQATKSLGIAKQWTLQKAGKTQEVGFYTPVIVRHDLRLCVASPQLVSRVARVFGDFDTAPCN